MVNGINFVVWAVAEEQAKAGHRVGILLTGKPSPAAESISSASGLELLPVSLRLWQPRFRLLALPDVSAFRPDVLHLHSVFSPMLARICTEAVRLDIPYVLTPHGGLTTEGLERSKFRKLVYSALVERTRFERARGITILTPEEEKNIRSFVPRFTGPIEHIANPIDDELAKGIHRDPIIVKRSPKLLYLGRLDVEQKGIDVLFAIAATLPNIELHIYGDQAPKSKKPISALMHTKPDNVFIHRPVYGQQKAEVLAAADMYVQCSRWEGFSISIAEAMGAGVPIAIADTMHLAPVVESLNLGLVVPLQAKTAAAMISQALANPDKLSEWSGNARRHALTHFRRKDISAKYVEFYRQAISD